MKKVKLIMLIDALAKSGGLKVDAGVLFAFDEKLAVWNRKSKAETATTLFQRLKSVAQDSLTSADVNEVKKELMMRPEFAYDFRASALHDSRLHVGKSMLRIDGETIGVTEARREDFSTEALDFQYLKRAKLVDAPVWMRFLQESFDFDADLTKTGAALNAEAEKILKHTSVRRLLEFLGYAVAPSGIWGAKKMLILLGPPNTGKSQILELVRRVKRVKGVVSMTPHDLGDRFRSGMLQDATLIVNDEVPTRRIKKLDILKKVIAGENVTCEQKGVDPKDFCPRVKLLFAGNQLPETAEPDYEDAFASRLSAVVFSKSVEAAARNIHLADDFFKERDVIFSLAVEALARLMKANYVFTADSAGDDAVSSYLQANNPLKVFLDPEMHEVVLGPEFSAATADLYERFKEFCERNAFETRSKSEFRTRLAQRDFDKKKVRTPGHANPRWGFAGIGLYPNGGGNNEN